ncbi:MAG: acetate--CoA ligase family protein [Beijerinckiaceae bacterium]|nr:acetate--CoA ligase family protein [Beijerinckiaceae bacterium]
MAHDKTPQGARTINEKIESLLNPRNVVIVGATDKPGNWPQRVWRNLKRFNYAGGVYPYNPSRDSVWETRCYRAFAELPEPPDHLVVLAPAKAVPALLREAAAAGARSATIMTSGFEEAPDEAGQQLGVDLRRAIEDTGLAVSGPNCLGNFNAAANFFTMPDDRMQSLSRGPVAVLGQSGGIVMAIKRTLEERGVDTDAAITSGNETGLTTADYIAFFATQPQIRVIACYLESVHDADVFLDALRAARDAGKHVVIMKLGASDAGRAAAAAHTGALAGSMEAFDAVAGAMGALRVRNLDEMTEAVEFLVHAPLPGGNRLGSITFSGGLRGLLLDAAHTNGLAYAPLSDKTHAKLSEILSVGSIVGNPLDAGFAALSSADAYIRCVEILLADEEIDILLLQEELPRGPGTERKEQNLRAVNELAAKASKPVAFVSMISYGLTDYSRQLRAQLPHLAFLQEVDKSLRTMRIIATHAEALRHATTPRVRAPSAEGRALLAQLSEGGGPDTLDEVASKRLLSAYGLATPRETLCADADAAVAAAARIGYPVVAKIVSAALPHKSDMGGVRVGLKDEAALREAFHAIMAAAEAHPDAPHVEGVLIAEMATGGLELVLGATRDPEMGAVILFGAGGVNLELWRDVALAACPLDEAGAHALIDRTRASVLIGGYRGKPALDRAALVRALLAVSDLMSDAQGAISEIDVNPYLLGESGGVALDALVVLSRPA